MTIYIKSNREKLLLQSQCWTNKQFDRTPKKLFRILGAPIYFLPTVDQFILHHSYKKKTRQLFQSINDNFVQFDFYKVFDII